MDIETANRLLQYRKKHNLSQEELANKIGVSRQAVSKWERAEASPDTDNLILLAEIYGVSLDELLKDLLIQRNRKADRCRSQQIAQVFCTVIIILIIDIENSKEYNDDCNGNQQRIENRKPKFFSRKATRI